MPLLKCACCDKSNEEHKMISCSICNDTYFHTCVDLNVSDIRSIKNKKNITWTCQKCSALGNSIQELKKLIVSMQREIENLKTIRSVPNSSIEFEEVVKEVSERQHRRNNIILYGIAENSSTERNIRILHDQQQTSKVLQYLLPESEFEAPIKPLRLGKYDNSRTTPRPLKIVLPSESLVHHAIRKAYTLKNLRDPGNVKISSDKTPKQQEYYRQLKDELARRTANGEDNLRIKYIRGYPQIVSSTN